MKTSITTKFNVGQKVWRIGEKETKCETCERTFDELEVIQDVIKQIDATVLKIDNEVKVEVLYGLVSGHEVWEIPEYIEDPFCYLFDDKKSADRFLKDHNKKERE